MKKTDIQRDATIHDLSDPDTLTDEQKQAWKQAGVISASSIEAACTAYANEKRLETPISDVPYYEHRDFPGLQVIPGLLPPETQVQFTSHLMHRDLANPDHKINLQAEYNIPYPPPPDPSQQSLSAPKPQHSTPSFFNRERAADADMLIPKVPSTQKPLNNEQFLHTKLRWLTLGEQYDWPTRSYAKHATAFPADLQRLVTGLFPHIRPESGVVLLYGAKDHMPVHRDVSEQCEQALASFSVGCDGVFILGRGTDDGEGDDAPRTLAIKVKSGTCIHLENDARWAWHSMARCIPGTCPPYLAEWPVGTPGATPAEEKMYKKWKGYIATKRINVSCRQVWD